ncbi:MAG: VWA domain-containing protein [Bdellovibrionales bacterium]|nr:VWA domain-containing protein [Bdellovibrionales bacterium]
MVLCFLCVSIAAQEEEPLDDVEDKLDVVLLLDGSGSMRVTDPKRLREESYKMFVEFLKQGDRMAVVEFSEKPKVLRGLDPYKEDQDKDIISVLKGVRDDGEYTNLLAPLKIAADLLKANPRPDAKQVIVMLSDGKMDPDPKEGPAAVLTSTLTTQLLPELKRRGVKVYTLSFSELADRAILSYIATSTNGVPWFTPTSDQIHESFAELFLVLKKPQVVPLTSKGFRIDADVEEATFYINRESGEEVTLLIPDGTKVTKESDDSKFKWFTGEQFDVITVRKPEPGQWQVLGLPKNEGFATVLTQLKLATNWPPSVYSGKEELLEVRMYESRKPVVLPEMTGTVRYAFRITPTDRVSEPVIKSFLLDDGSEGDRVARDGIFSAKVALETPGEYKLQVVASGPTFERHQQIAFKVKPRLLSLVVVNGEESLMEAATPTLEAGDATSREYFQLRTSSELSQKKKLEVSLLAVDKNNNKYTLPLAKFDNVYEVATKTLPHQGEFKIQGFFTGEGRKKGKSDKGESEQLSYVSLEEVPGGVATQVVQVQSPTVQIIGQAPAEQSDPWIIYLLVMSVINIGAGMGGWMMSKKQSLPAGGDDGADNLKANDEFIALVAHLEEVAANVEVDLESDLFTDTNRAIIKREGGSALASISASKGDGEPEESNAEASDEESEEQEAEQDADDGLPEEDEESLDE